MPSNEHSPVLHQQLPTVGEQFDKYTLLAKLATGGMAELFVAQLSGAAGFSKNVVIKRILPHVAHDENFTRMFLDEALTCAQITHPNVCQVFELCEANGSHFLVLEHLEGATVGDLIQRCIAADQQVNLRLAAGIIVQACDGLQAAHEQVDADGKSIGLVHRDVSPANLFVTVDGIVKVLDFGIAKAGWMSRKTRTGTLLGKCEYMSPEQARGGVPVDRRSDIFSLGITAWELLCGRRLFRRETEYDTLKAVLRAPIESPRSLRPTVPEALDRAIMCALERDRSDRFRTAYEFRKAIAKSLRSVGGPTPMCDIAPVIRKSFSDELKIQRAVLKKAIILSSKIHASKSNSGQADLAERVLSKRDSGQADVVKSVQSTRDSGQADLSQHNSVQADVAQHDPKTEETATLVDPGDNRGFQDEAQMSSGTLPTPSPNVPEVVFDIHSAETEVNPPLSSHFWQEAEAEQQSQAPKPAAADTRAVKAAKAAATKTQRSETAKSSAAVQKQAKSEARSAVAAHTIRPSRVDTEKRRDDKRVGTTLVVILFSACLAAAATFFIVRIVNQKNTENQPAQTKLPLPAPQARAVVTSIEEATIEPPSVGLGVLAVTSTISAQIYLYPEKKLLGTTPILDIKLPPGVHKLKAELKNGEKKYFEIRIESGKTSNRRLAHWSK